MKKTTKTTEPHIFFEGHYAKEDIEMFKKNALIWKVCDVYKDQLYELFEIQNPSLRHLDSYEQKRGKFVKNKLAQESAGNWVYFPWNGRFVHMVTEDEHIQLYTNRNKNLVTEEEQNILRDFTPAIAGLSVGSGIAGVFTYSGIGREMKFAEYDTLETSNFNRIKARIDQIGMSKMDVVSQQVYEANPYAQITRFDKGLNNDNIKDFVQKDPIPKIIFEIIDSFEMKIRLRLLAREAGIPVVMFANIGDNIVVDIERFDLDRNTPLFNGLVGSVPEEILEKPDITEEDKNIYILKLFDKKLVPKRAMESLKEINKTLVSRPQLAGTVTISSGLSAYITRMIALSGDLSGGRMVVRFKDLLYH